jgi:hypothetical protein
MGVEQVRLPDKWFVKKIDTSENEAAWWIAANPYLGEGKIFAKDEHEDAMTYAAQRATETGSEFEGE